MTFGAPAGTLAEMSPVTKARLAGGFYALQILLGGFAGSIQDRLLVSGDAAATASNILAHPGLLRLGFAAYMVEMAFAVVATALLYDLLKAVDRSASLLAAFFGLVAITIKTFSRVFYVAPLLLLGSAGSLGTIAVEQRQTLALLLLKVNVQGAAVAMVFFGCYALLTGYLIVRSTFLPRILGVLGMVAGVGWLTYLYPPLADRLVTYVVGLALLGAAAKVLWLLVFGVNEARWREQSSAAGASIWG